MVSSSAPRARRGRTSRSAARRSRRSGRGWPRRPRAAPRSSTRPAGYVIPGGVDVHVHLELPFCGTVSSDDWNTGTRAAARGGVTTVIDFAIPYGEESPGRRLQQLDGPGQAQGVRRLLLPHGHHQLGPPRPRDGEAGRDGLPDVQGVHDLRVRGLAVGRPGDLQHARAVPGPGGDAAGARRVEPRARRADRAASHARADADATAPGCTR